MGVVRVIAILLRMFVLPRAALPVENLVCISKTLSGPRGTADTGAIEPIGADTPGRSTSRTPCNGRCVHVGAGPSRQVRSAPLTAKPAAPVSVQAARV